MAQGGRLPGRQPLVLCAHDQLFPPVRSMSTAKKRVLPSDDDDAPLVKKSKQPVAVGKAAGGAVVAAAAVAAAAAAAPEEKDPGCVLVFGSNECLQLGLGEDITERKKPGLVKAFEVWCDGGSVPRFHGVQEPGRT
jgi:hypothetical protein